MGKTANANSEIRTLCANLVTTCKEFGVLVAVSPNFGINFLGDLATVILSSDLEINFVKV